jgi:putative transposase
MWQHYGMPRQARLDIAGLLQHVMVRGIERRDIFVDDRDRLAFLERLSRLLIKTATDCLAWSLLTNHVHLLLRPTKGKLSEMMRRLLTGYAVVFNLRHNRCGHLFQNRYKSIVCEEDSYLLELVRYIHLNPIRVGMVSSVRQLDSYHWTGHAVIMGHAPLPGQDVDQVLQMFDDDKFSAREKYRDFVAEGVTLGRRNELVGGGLKRQLKLSSSLEFQAYDERILGSGEFVEQLWNETESPKAAEPDTPPSIEEIIEQVAAVFKTELSALRQGSKQKRLSDTRGAICFIAMKRFGYSGVQLSKCLTLSRSGVIVAAERGEGVCRMNPKLWGLFPGISGTAPIPRSE